MKVSSKLIPTLLLSLAIISQNQIVSDAQTIWPQSLTTSSIIAQNIIIEQRLQQAITFQKAGQFQQAINILISVLSHYQSTGNRLKESEVLNHLGNAYLRLGNYRQAVELYEQALAIANDLQNPTWQAISLNNLGNAYQAVGQFALATERYEEYFIADQLREDGFISIRGGDTYLWLGQYRKALNAYEATLSLVRSNNNVEGEVTTLRQIGDVYLQLEEFELALDYYSQAYELVQTINDQDGLAQILESMANAYMSIWAFDNAIDLYQQSAAIYAQLNESPSQARVLSQLGKVFFQIRDLQQAEQILFEAIEIYESLRLDLPDAERISIFETQIATYATLQKALVEQSKYEIALEISERSRARAFINLLTARLSSVDSLSAEPPDIDKIRQIAHIQKSVLVEYSITQDDFATQILYIWVVQPTGEIEFRTVPLVEEGLTIAKLVNQSRENIGRRDRGGLELVTTTPEDIGQLRELHQLLIEPIVDLLPTDPSQRVTLIPQGELFLVPFPALQNEAGDYLIQHHTILTAPSIQTLELTHKQKQILESSSRQNLQNILAIGNPTMPEIWNPKTTDVQQLSILPGTEQEAIEIATLFDTEALVRDEATEAIVKERIQDAGIIHFATHGLLEYGNPQDSGIRDIPGAIALTPSHSEDGLLTAAEISDGLNLNAELVILSACDTGLGKITGDGVIGLSRTLIAAGAPSVIVSLWSVPDAPTAELMVNFYHYWQQEGLDKAQALRQAMLTTLKTHPEPENWAAFTLIGEAE